MLFQNKRYYLDYAASTPLADGVLHAMKPYWTHQYANPASIHQSGRYAHETVEQSVQKVKRIFLLNRDDQVVWTSGGTESNHIVIDSVIARWKKQNPNKRYTIAISSIEHPSVVDYLENIDDPLLQIEYIPVDSFGKIDLVYLESQVGQWENLILVSCIFQSSEVGSTQPIKDLSRIIRNRVTGLGEAWPVLHVDASQGLYYHRINIRDWGVHMVTICGQKIGGPKGSAALLLHNVDTNFVTREGTVAVPLVVGLTKALDLAQENTKENAQKIVELRSLLSAELSKTNVDFRVNGILEEKSLIMNLSFNRDSRDSEQLVIAFDQIGLEVSSKSACMGSQAEDSRVLDAMDMKAKNSIRLCLHHSMKKKDIIVVAKRIALLLGQNSK